MVQFLKENINVFAWQPYNMPCIDSKVMCHKIHFDLTTNPIKQKPCRASSKKAKAIEEEIQKLLKAVTVRKAEFPDWISNQVVVKKHNRKWRVCVDFTNLNRACPNDSFPLSRIY